MIIFILFLCFVAAIFSYFFVLRPIALFLFVPLNRRIPTGREYMPRIGVRR